MAWTPTTPTPPPVLKVPGWYAVLILNGAGNIPSAEAFGIPIVARSQKVLLTGIPSGEVFGAPVVRYLQSISPTGIISLQAFGGSVLQPGAVQILTQGIGSSESVGTPTVSPGKAFIFTVGIPSGLAFGTTTITTGPVGITLPAGIASAEAFGTPSIKYLVGPPGIISEETFGAHALSLKITTTGIPTAEAFGIAYVYGPPQVITPAGIASAEAFGGSVLQPGPVSILAQGIPGAEALGAPALTVGNVNVAPAGIASAEAFGTNKIGMYLIPTGIPSAESVGAATVTSLYTVTATGIPSAEAFGTPTLTKAVVLTIVGTPTVNNGGGSGATSIALPAHAIGDLIVLYTWVPNTNVSPKPAASGTVPNWVLIDAGAGGVSATTCYQFKATATNHTSGTWVYASALAAVVLRGQATNPIGGHGATEAGQSTSGGNSPAVTMGNTSGSSILLHFFGIYAASANWGAAPTGYTKLNSAYHGNYSVCVDKKDVSTSDGACFQPIANPHGLYCRGQTVEILA